MGLDSIRAGKQGKQRVTQKFCGIMNTIKWKIFFLFVNSFFFHSRAVHLDIIKVFNQLRQRFFLNGHYNLH